MSTDMNIDKNHIKSMRLKHNWSQEEFSIVAGISLRTIQRIEKDGVTSMSSLKALANAFEINVEQLKRKSSSTNEPKLSTQYPKTIAIQEKVQQAQESITNPSPSNNETAKIVKYFYSFVFGFFVLRILYKYLF